MLWLVILVHFGGKTVDVMVGNIRCNLGSGLTTVHNNVMVGNIGALRRENCGCYGW